MAHRQIGEQEREQTGPVPAHQKVMAIAAKEKEVNGCGKFSWRRIRAVPSAAATKIIAAP